MATQPQSLHIYLGTNPKEPLSLDRIAKAIMNKTWYNKELKINLTPKEYNSETKVLIFSAVSPDGKTKFRYSSPVRDIQHRVSKQVLVPMASNIPF